MRGASVALALLLAGCAEAILPPAGGELEWHLGGSWTTEYTEADIDAWCEIAKAYGNECLVMESFPPQYGLRFASEATCLQARSELLRLERIHVGECRRVEPSADPEQPTSTSAPSVTPTHEGPPQGPVTDYDVRTFRVTWWDGDPASRKHDQTWDVVRAWSQDGLVRIEVTTHGIEGGDFRFSLRYAPREPHGGVLFPSEGAGESGSFDFSYTEAIFWSGREIEGVAEVARGSYVRIEAQDEQTRTLRGSFHLDFVGRCPICEERGRSARTVLEGSFGA